MQSWQFSLAGLRTLVWVRESRTHAPPGAVAYAAYLAWARAAYACSFRRLHFIDRQRWDRTRVMRCKDGQLAWMQPAMRCSPQSLHSTSIQTRRPWGSVPSCGPEETPSAHKVTGCRARRIKQSCGDFLGGRWATSGRCGGRPTSPCRSCCCMCRMLSVGMRSCRSGPTNRIASNLDRIRVNNLADVPDPTLVCCVLSSAPRGVKIHQAPTWQVPLAAGIPQPSSVSLASPRPTLIDSPATRIATRHRDRFFWGCVIHAGRGVPHHYGTT
ncbi:hypothetical protein F5883DRAFT_250831 [Diaporthe sp. PMI_573]|nr:hypothetical protein F5883DRAFT_250831 [Diaporthaceae sp. PMI_573]